ncbi:zinc-ribbon domain-containing protein [Eubacterium ventriosum]
MEKQDASPKILCPHCDTPNESNAGFCVNCGNVLY